MASHDDEKFTLLGYPLRTDRVEAEVEALRAEVERLKTWMGLVTQIKLQTESGWMFADEDLRVLEGPILLDHAHAHARAVMCSMEHGVRVRYGSGFPPQYEFTTTTPKRTRETK